MSINKYNEFSGDELNVKLNELKQELFNLRFSHTTGQLTNPNQLVKCRRDIARVKTEIRRREIAAFAKSSAGKK